MPFRITDVWGVLYTRAPLRSDGVSSFCCRGEGGRLQGPDCLSAAIGGRCREEKETYGHMETTNRVLFDLLINVIAAALAVV